MVSRSCRLDVGLSAKQLGPSVGAGKGLVGVVLTRVSVPRGLKWTGTHNELSH